MTPKLKQYGLRAFVIGAFCALCFLLGQVATYTTYAQLPAVSPGGTFNLLSDSPSMAFNADSSGTRNWFLRPVGVTPIVTGNWSNFGTGCTRTAGTNYLSVAGTTGTSNSCGYQITVGAGDFSHILVATFTTPIVSPSSNTNVMAGFTDGTKVEGCGTTEFPSIDCLAQSTLTGSGSTMSGRVTNTAGPLGNPFVFKLTRVGSTLSVYNSFDGGLTYILDAADTIPFLTASAITVYVNPRGSTASTPGTLTLISYQ